MFSPVVVQGGPGLTCSLTSRNQVLMEPRLTVNTLTQPALDSCPVSLVCLAVTLFTVKGGVYPSALGRGGVRFLCQGLQCSFMVMVPHLVCSSAVYISNRGNRAAHWRPLQPLLPVHTLYLTVPVVYFCHFAIVKRKLKCVYTEE